MGAKESETEAQESNIIRRRRVPTEKPPFTLTQLKKAVPPHCFERSVLRSFSYVVSDIAVVSILMSFAVYIIPTLPFPFNHAAWLFYWFCQGCVLHGIWVLAHECGHRAFSNYQLLDDTVGFLLHSALLVPYFSFKYSHRRHHTNSGSIEKDEVLVPRVRSRFPWILNYLNSPPGRAVKILVGLVTGWPFYLAFNMSGRPYPSFVSHYYPYSPIFSERERAWVLLSDAGVLAGYYSLYRLAAAYSVGWVVRMYGVPWVTVNMWLVLTVYLQHAHPALPRYDSTEWDWMRGGLVTVDRDYGVLNDVFHNISNTHVVHHFFPSMPQYHAVEATEAIKAVLGEYYLFDPTPIGKALWREVRECLYLEGEGEERKGVYWFKNEL